jgi:transposase
MLLLKCYPISEPSQKDYQKRTRLHALWLLRQGCSLGEAAAMVGAGYRTVHRWVTWYRAGGLAEVLRRRHGGRGGRRARLTAAQEAALRQHAETGALRSIWDGVHWVAQEYQVSYTYWGMRRVFERLGLRPKVPRSRSPQASAAEQEAWKKEG